MLIQADAKQLEWVVINWLSQDPVGMQEIIDEVDVHSKNQERFGLPERVVAKIFVFRLIYGGSDYSYSHDPDFMGVSRSQRFWKEVIEKFYDKYKGIAACHAKWVATAIATGYLEMPTGRKYFYQPYKNYRDETQWPRTRILNYPVQGLATDLMSIARVSFKRRLDALDSDIRANIKLVSTVHDSIISDILDESLRPLVEDTLHGVFHDIPSNFKSIFGIEFNLPLRCEITCGPNLKDLV